MNERKLGPVAGATVIAATLAAGSASNAGAVQITVDEVGRTVLVEAPSDLVAAVSDYDIASKCDTDINIGCINKGCVVDKKAKARVMA